MPVISARDLIRARAKERLDGDFGGASKYVKMLDKCRWFKPEPDREYVLPFVGYIVKTEHHPDRVPAGIVWPRRPFWTHREIGPERMRVLCLRSIGERCPICEDRAQLIQTGADKAISDLLKTSYRELYIMPAEKAEDGWEVMEMAWSNFGKALDRKINRLTHNDDNVGYFEVANGASLVCFFAEESMGTNKFVSLDEISFDRREDFEFSHAAVPCLDDCLNPIPYKRLKALHLEVPEDEVDEEAPPPETSGRGRSRSSEPEQQNVSRGRAGRTVSEPDQTAVTRSRGARVAPPAEEKLDMGKAGEKKNTPPVDDNICPSGHEFGVETDKYADDCEQCDMWKACMRAKRSAEVLKESPGAEPDAEPAAQGAEAPAASSRSRFSGRGGRRG